MSDVQITLSLSESDRDHISDCTDQIVSALLEVAHALAPLNTTTREFHIKDENGTWKTEPNPFFKEPV